MKVCIKCGYRDNPLWRNSRFDFNAEYMRFDEGQQQSELKQICDLLQNMKTVELSGHTYYKRGKGGIYLYRVPTEDYKVPRERKRHNKKKARG